jgi:hypothetical protein
MPASPRPNGTGLVRLIVDRALSQNSFTRHIRSSRPAIKLAPDNLKSIVKKWGCLAAVEVVEE